MPGVLIVDDEPLIRWSLCESLEDAGYQVEAAASAREALTKIDPVPADLRVVLLDLKLPDSSDLGLLRRVRELAPGSRIILMTAHGTREMLDEALRLGAYRVLTKPFDLHEVVALVASAVSP